MAKNPSNWKYKAESQWEKLQKNIAKAESRGYIVPNEIKDIKKPQGGYKQSYEKIHKLDLNTIQRQSTYVSPFHGEGVIPGGRAMSIAREMQRDIKTDKDTYVPVEHVYSSMKSLSSREPSVTINENDEDLDVPEHEGKDYYEYYTDDYYDSITEDEDYESWYEESEDDSDEYYDESEIPYEEPQDNRIEYNGYYVDSETGEVIAPIFDAVDELSPFESEETMSQEVYYEQIDSNIRDILKSFKSYPLRKKLEKDYYQKLRTNYVGTLDRINSQRSEVVEDLQKAAQIKYENNADYKEEESQYANWWTEVLRG